MTNKRKTISRRKFRGRQKTFFPFVGLLILFLVSTYGFAYFSLYGLLHWDLLRIQEVKIKGTKFLDEDKLYQYLVGFIGENMFDLSDQEVQNILSKFPRIQSAKIIRMFPHTLKISVQERTPIAILQISENNFCPIDKQGHPLDYVTEISQYNIPIFSGIDTKNLTLGTRISDSSMKELLKIYHELKKQDFLHNISEFSIDDGEVVLVENKRGIKCLLGSEKFSERIDKLILVYNNYGILKFSEIDLRYSDMKNEDIILR